MRQTPSWALRFQRERVPFLCVETGQREEKGEVVTVSLECELVTGSVLNILNLLEVCGRIGFKLPGSWSLSQLRES